MQTNQQMSPSSRMIYHDEKNNLQPYLEKRPKTDQQTQLSSTSTNISTFPQHQSENTIHESISGATYESRSTHRKC